MTFTLPTLDKNDKRGSFYNGGTRSFLIDNYGWDLDDAPEWVNDCVYGAVGQIGGDSRYSGKKLYTMLLSMTIIDKDTVSDCINRLNRALGEPDYSDSFTYKVMAALRCASKAVQYHKNYHKIVPITRDTMIETATWSLPYNAEEMSTLKSMALRLSKDVSWEEFKAYEDTLKKKYRM